MTSDIVREDMHCIEPVKDVVVSRPKAARKSSAGRKGTSWHFNREKYDEMKEDGGRTEF